MSTALAEHLPPLTVTPAPEVTLAAVGLEAPDLEPVEDRDGIEVYCPEAQAWSRTRDLFCETCGATDHDLR